MNTKRLLKATFVTLMVCATAGTLFACRDKDDDKEYKVVYLGGDGATGEAPATVNYKEGAKFTVANNTFTKEDHTFDGWSDGTSTYLEGVEYTMGAADVTFTAQWKKNTTVTPEPETKYTVTYALGDHASSMASVPTRVKDLESGATVKLPKGPDAAPGYKFTGWKIGDGEDAEIKQAGEEITVTESIVVTAQWESTKVPEKYTVTYELGDHAATDATAPTAETDLDSNATVKLPKAPAAATGYEFKGWKVGTETELKNPDDEITVTDNVTVTAQWKIKVGELHDIVLGTEIKNEIKAWYTANSKFYYVAEGEELTVQATVKKDNPDAWSGVMADINLNDDFYRFRPDHWVWTDKLVHAAIGNPDAMIEREEPIWTDDTVATYKGLFADGASVIQVIKISLKDNVVTYTITSYAGTDTELTTPIVSATSKVTSKTDISVIQPYFYADGGATITSASAKAKSYSYVEYAFDNAKGDDADPDKYAVHIGDEYTFGAPTRAGYTFAGWKSSDEADTKLYVQGDKITVAGALTFTAQWTQDEYTVTYALGENHATDATAPTAVTGKHYGDTITLPAEADTPAAAEGYEFKGWKVGTDTELKAAGAEVEITGAVTITAVYEAKAQYTATFNVGDHAAAGETVPSETVYYDDAEIDLPAAPVAAEHYVFAGWKIGEEVNAEIKQEGKVTLTASITITAQWAKEKYTAKFELGTNPAADAEKPADVTVDYDAKAKLPEAPAAADGYTFTGWQIGNDTSTLVAAEAEVTLNGKETIYTAQWTNETYSVTFKADAESEVIETKTLGEGAILVAPEASKNPTKPGHRFAGWYLSTDTTKTPIDETTTVTGDATYYAIWVEQVTATFLKNDGNTEENPYTATVDKGEALTELPNAPTREDYKFLGWYDSEATGDREYLNAASLPTLDGNKTYIADWKAIFTVTIKDDLNGEAVTGAKTEYDNNGSEGTPETLQLPADLSEDGLTFKGWFLVVDNEGEKEYGAQVTTETEVTSNMVIAAKWAITVTYELGENHATDATAPTAEEVEKHEGKVTLPTAPAAATDHRFLGWKVGDDTELKAAGAEIDVTADVTITAQYGFHVEIGTADNALGYTGFTPIWTNKVAKGETVTLKGTMTSKAALNHQTVLMYIWDEAVWGSFRMDWYVIYDQWAKAENGVDQLNDSDIASENWHAAKSIGPDWGTYLGSIANCDITITFDWSSPRTIRVSATVVSKAEGNAANTMSYTIIPKGGAFAKNEYNIGLGGEDSYTVITEKTVVQRNDNPTVENPVVINSAGYAPIGYVTEINKGEKIEFTGKSTSVENSNWFAPFVSLFRGTSEKLPFRSDNYIIGADGANDPKAENLAAEGWASVAKAQDCSGVGDDFWPTMCALKNNGDLKVTVDWTGETIIVTMAFTGKIGEVDHHYTQTYTITLEESNTDTNYQLALGGEKCTYTVNSIVRTPAEAAD